MKKTTLQLLLLIGLFGLFANNAFSQITTLNWVFPSNNAAVNPTQSITVDGITATYTSGNTIVSGIDGSAEPFVLVSGTHPTNSVTISFNQAVNLISLEAVEFSGGKTWTFTPTGGGNSPVNSSISEARYSPPYTRTTVSLNWTGVTSFTITSSGGNSAFPIDNFKIATAATNSAPVIANTSAGQVVNDNSTISPFSAVTITDVDGDNLSTTITLDSNAKGVLSGTGLLGSGPYSIASTSAATLQARLRALSFNPTDNRTSASETTTFTLVVSDGTDNDTDNTTTVISSAVAPTVTSVSVPTNGTYKAAQNLNFTVNFSENVTVNTTGGTPQLSLTVGSDTKQATYISGSGTSALVFRYTVQTGDLDTDGISVGTLSSNGGSIQDAGGKGATLTLNSVGSTGGINVDAVAPTVASVSVPSNDTYTIGRNLDFTVNFSEVVTVAGVTKPQLSLTVGGSTKQADYLSGSTSNQIIFRYTIQAGDEDTNGITVNSLALNGGFVRDFTGNNANLTLNSVGATTGVNVDGNPPTVTSVSVPTNATYSSGQNLDFTVNFSENVNLNTTGGTPQLSLTVGGDTKQATYISGSGISALLFRYTVQTGDLDTDGISVGTLSANGGTIKATNGTDATLTLNNVGVTTSVLVDGVAPTVTSVSVPANATYITGQNLDFTVNFSENVNVNTTGGTPQLEITIGSDTKQATYTSGSGSSSILFRYVVQTGDLDADGITVGTLSGNGGTIKDAGGNNANLTVNSVGVTTSVLVDGVAPTVTSVTVPNNENYSASQNLDFTVNFSENINVNTAGGTPQLSITVGSDTKEATYISGSGSSSLVFRYVVQTGNLDTDGITVGTLSANGGTLKDAGGNNTNLTLNSVGTTTGVLVDGTDAEITSVTAPANKTYGAGQNLDFQVNFDKVVNVNTVGGTPQISLTIGAITRQAAYVIGSGGKTLSFRYIVQAGDLDADGITVGTLSANGGTIQDSGGNDAVLTLNSVGVTTGVLVDGVAPTITSVTVPTNSTYSANQNLDFQVTFDKNVNVNTTGGTPQISLTIGSTTRQAAYVIGSGGKILSFRYIVQAVDVDSDGIAVGTLSTNGGTIQDAVGNNANVTLNSLGTTTGVLVNGAHAEITSVTVPTNRTYVVGENLDFQVNFDKDVNVNTTGGTPQISISIGATTRQAAYVIGSGKTISFRYVVQAGDLDADGITVGTLSANGGTIQDAGGNNANLTLNNVGVTTSVLVDTVSPTITGLGLHNDNQFVEIFTTEGLYSTSNGSGALEISDISISIAGGSATNPVITSLKDVSGASDLVGGENIIRVNFTTTGVADGSEIVTINFADGNSVFDAAGNPAVAIQSNNTTTLNDLIKPSITGVSLATDNSYVDVTFNEGVYGEDSHHPEALQASDFDLKLTGGTAMLTGISSVKQNDNTNEASATALVGGETTIRIFFSISGTPDGSEVLEVDLQAGEVYDSGDNTADADQTNNTVNLADKVSPSVTISSSVSNPTNASPFSVTFTMSEDVTNFDSIDITLTNATVSNFTTVNNAEFTADITPTSDGAVSVSVASGKLEDLAGNLNTVSNTLSTNYDGTAPTSLITTTAFNPINTAVTANISFSEDVTGFDISDIVANNSTISNFTAVNAKMYTVLVTPIADGATGFTIPVGSAQDAVGNDNEEGQFVMQYDNSPPSLTSSSSAAAVVNGAFTVDFVFSENVINFDIADIVVTNATVSNFVETNKEEYSATITPITDGSVTVDVAANVALDGASNGNTAGNQLTRTFDGTNPTVNITSTQSNFTNSAFTTTFTFSEDVTGFDSNDIALTNATVSNFMSVSNTVYTALITPSIDGNVTVDVNAGVAQDVATNNNDAATQFSILYDNTNPTVSLGNVVSGTTNSAFTTTFTFSEDVTGFDSNDISLTNATASDFVSVSNTVYTALITPIADGNVIVNVNANVAVDNANNGNDAASPFSITFDGTNPTVSITSTQSNFTNSAFTTTFTFSEDVTGFDSNDITLTNATVSNFVSVSNTVYTALITPNADGNVIVDVNAGVAQDAVNNNNDAATPFSILYDNTNPTVSFSNAVSGITNSSFTTTINFSETVNNFTIADVKAGNASLSNFVSVSGSQYTVLVTPNVDGVVTLNINAAVATDNANNSNEAASQFSIVYDATNPTVTLTPSVSGSTNAPFTVTFAFSEDVTQFDVSDLVLTNANASNFTATNAKEYSALITAVDINQDVTVTVPDNAAIDVANNGNLTASISVVSDGTPPDKPKITHISEYTCSGNVAMTGDNTLEIFGIVEKEALVEVFIDGSSVGSVNTDSNGNFKFDYTSVVLADGSYSITAKATDFAGNTSELSNPLNITINSVDTDNDGLPDFCDEDYDGNGVIDANEDCDNDGIVDSLDTDTSSCSESISMVKRYGISPDGDGINDAWIVKDILSYPNNTVRVFNRSGALVYIKSGYKNDWKGVSNQLSTNTGREKRLPVGPYLFIIDLGDGSKLTRGWLYINY